MYIFQLKYAARTGMECRACVVGAGPTLSSSSKAKEKRVETE
jgi:hypothetical protein